MATEIVLPPENIKDIPEGATTSVAKSEPELKPELKPAEAIPPAPAKDQVPAATENINAAPKSEVPAADPFAGTPLQTESPAKIDPLAAAPVVVPRPAGVIPPVSTAKLDPSQSARAIIDQAARDRQTVSLPKPDTTDWKGKFERLDREMTAVCKKLGWKLGDNITLDQLIDRRVEKAEKANPPIDPATVAKLAEYDLALKHFGGKEGDGKTLPTRISESILQAKAVLKEKEDKLVETEKARVVAVNQAKSFKEHLDEEVAKKETAEKDLKKELDRKGLIVMYERRTNTVSYLGIVVLILALIGSYSVYSRFAGSGGTDSSVNSVERAKSLERLKKANLAAKKALEN